MDMREYISQKLNDMQSTTEKDILREVMENIFIPLYDHVEGQYSELERRVKDEMSLNANLFAIWTTIVERDQADGGCPYMFPMIEPDIDKPSLDLSRILTRLRAEQEVCLDTVFIEADYLVCKKMIDSKEILTGTIEAENMRCSIGVRLRPAKRYMSCIENLYRLFISNAIPWQTVYSPYLFKMFDVMLVRMEANVDDTTGTMRKYEVNYGPNDKYVKKGFVPVWNVQKKRIKSDDFPLAALDKVNYEYVFELAEEGAENGYLADYASADISVVRREKNALIVTSPAPKGLEWEMHKIVKKQDYVTDHFTYELKNNLQGDSFTAKMVSRYGAMIKTKAELVRLLNAYDASRFIELDSFQVLSGAAASETYEVNTFLTDEVRDLAVSKSLLLRFKPLKRNSYLARDAMSFLASQVQLVYPEFHCVGVLV